jgi:hypothetical protein
MGFTVVQRASVPTAPFSQTVREAHRLLRGLVIGVGLAFLLDRLDR